MLIPKTTISYRDITMDGVIGLRIRKTAIAPTGLNGGIIGLISASMECDATGFQTRTPAPGSGPSIPSFSSF
jgi:hypothetical protein